MKQFFLSKRKVPGSQVVSAGSAPLRMSRLSLSSQQGHSEILGGENVSPSGLSINLCGRDLRCFQRPYHAPQKEAKSFHRRWNSQSNLECIVPGCCPNLQLEQVGFFKQADFQTIMLWEEAMAAQSVTDSVPVAYETDWYMKWKQWISKGDMQKKSNTLMEQTKCRQPHQCVGHGMWKPSVPRAPSWHYLQCNPAVQWQPQTCVCQGVLWPGRPWSVLQLLNITPKEAVRVFAEHEIRSGKGCHVAK